jgi:hypothetical protein
VEAVRTPIQQSPEHSAHKHAMALGISSLSLRRILHADLKLHPYKMMLAQELSEIVMFNGSTFGSIEMSRHNGMNSIKIEINFL